jgi:uncharacterized protein with beta-barrel porin domain
MGMSKVLARTHAALASMATRWILLALTICAPVHSALAQTDVNVSVTGGDAQSGLVNTQLSTPLTAHFSSSSYFSSSTVFWTVQSGNATFVESAGTSYQAPVNFPGDSSVNLMLGSSPGTVTVTATCSECVDVATFTETITAQPVALSLVSGNNQSAQVYQSLPSPLVVGFSGPGNVTLDWQISGNTGAVFAQNFATSYSQSLTTTAGSTSQVGIYLGSKTGTFKVTATCSAGCSGANNSVAYNVTATPAPPYLQMDIVSGSSQSGSPNTTLPQPLVVSLTATPNGFDGPFTVPVVWEIASGTAKFAANNSQSFTDDVQLSGGLPGRPNPGGAGNVNPRAAHPTSGGSPSGISEVSLVLGDTPGPVVVVATCSYCTLGATRVFRLTINPPTDTGGTLGKVSGDNQSGLVNTAASAPLVVQAGAIAGQTVNWKVLSGPATLSAATSVTADNGQASMNFTYGSTPGQVTIEASVGDSSVEFVATAVAAGTGPTAASGNNQTATVGTTLQPFVVQIGSGATNGGNTQSSSPSAFGNIAVTWSVLQGGGTLASTQTLTDATGRTSNTLTLGANPGTTIVQASIAGAGSVTFTAVATPAITAGSTTFAIVSGNNQDLVPNQPSQPLVVKLASSGGAPIPGATIQWNVTGATGTLANPSSITGVDGTAQNTLTVVLPGTYTVSAQVAGVQGIAPLTFNFSNGVANLTGLSPTQVGIAKIIDKACPALATSTAPLTPQQQDFLQRCSELVVGANGDRPHVPDALRAMLNNKALPQRSLAQGVQSGQISNLNTRFAELRQGATGFSAGGLTLNQDGRGLPLAMLGDLFRKDPATNDEVGKDFSRWGFFATGMIERGGFDATAVRPGFDFHSASLTTGVDYRFNDSFVAGAALGYNQNNSSFDSNAGKVDVDGYNLTGYFSWYRGDWYLEGSVVLDKLDYDLDRNIAYQIASLSGGTTAVSQTASASPSGDQNSLSLSAGKDFNRKAWTFSPYVRGVYSHLSLDGFSETMSDPNGAGAGLGTSVASRSMNSMLGLVGARVSYTTSFDWGVLVPNAVVEWNHEFRNDPQTIVVRFLADPTQTPISLTDQAPDSNYFNVGFGLNAVFAQGRSAYVYYQHMTGYSGAHSDQLSLGIRIEF